MTFSKLTLLLTALAIFAFACVQKSDVKIKIQENVGELLAKFAPVEITADISFLPENEKKALTKLIAASKYMDEIFLRQV